MKILNEKPPEWIMDGCLSQFRVNIERTFWTYGDTIYNPGGIDIRHDIMAHEEQHMRQQAAYKAPDAPSTVSSATVEGAFAHACGDGKDGWWKRYLAEPRFRLEQEAEAYGTQYRFFCSQVKDRNQRTRFLFMIADQLSGPLYQTAVTHAQARTMIEVLAGKKQLPKAS